VSAGLSANGCASYTFFRSVPWKVSAEKSKGKFCLIQLRFLESAQMASEHIAQSPRRIIPDEFAERQHSNSEFSPAGYFGAQSNTMRFAQSRLDISQGVGGAIPVAGGEIDVPVGRSAGNGRTDAKIMSAPAPGRRGPGGWVKRGLDLILATLALILAAPLMIIVCIAIRVFMGGPVFYAQERVGLRGRRFMCFKFRTMATNGDAILREHLRGDAAAAIEWRRSRKLAVDPRVGPLGRFLRKSSLDELPQLFNILRGDMSCVGPRPIQEEELAYYGAHRETYLSAVPGLTGLWQCSGRSSLSYDQRVELDAFYVQNRTLLLDLSIMLRTIPTLLKFDQSA